MWRCSAAGWPRGGNERRQGEQMTQPLLQGRVLLVSAGVVGLAMLLAGGVRVRGPPPGGGGEPRPGQAGRGRGPPPRAPRRARGGRADAARRRTPTYGEHP